MDEEEIIIIEEDDDFRNAPTRIIRRSRGRGRSSNRARSRSRSRSRPQQPVLMAQPAPAPVEERRGSGFGNLDSGELLALGLKALSALDPLPQPPRAVGGPSDLSNLVIYQNNLAVHAKRAQQLAILGDVLKEVLD